MSVVVIDDKNIILLLIVKVVIRVCIGLSVRCNYFY